LHQSRSQASGSRSVQANAMDPRASAVLQYWCDAARRYMVLHMLKPCARIVVFSFVASSEDAADARGVSGSAKVMTAWHQTEWTRAGSRCGSGEERNRTRRSRRSLEQMLRT
jgi:hypothetical protein